MPPGSMAASCWLTVWSRASSSSVSWIAGVVVRLARKAAQFRRALASPSWSRRNPSSGDIRPARTIRNEMVMSTE